MKLCEIFECERSALPGQRTCEQHVGARVLGDPPGVFRLAPNGGRGYDHVFEGFEIAVPAHTNQTVQRQWSGAGNLRLAHVHLRLEPWDANLRVSLVTMRTERLELGLVSFWPRPSLMVASLDLSTFDLGTMPRGAPIDLQLTSLDKRDVLLHGEIHGRWSPS